VIPQLVTVKVHNGRGRRIRLFIPLIPVLLVLSPLLILLMLAVAVACLAYRINVVRALRVGWQVLWSLRGTRIEVKQGGTAVLVNLG
jgi:hypothetical protein